MIACIPSPAYTHSHIHTHAYAHHVRVINSRPRWKHRKRRTANNAVPPPSLARFLFYILARFPSRRVASRSRDEYSFSFLLHALFHPSIHPSWPFSARFSLFFKRRAAKVRKLARTRKKSVQTRASVRTTAWKFINGWKLGVMELFIIRSRICIPSSSLNLRHCFFLSFSFVVVAKRSFYITFPHITLAQQLLPPRLIVFVIYYEFSYYENFSKRHDAYKLLPL